MFNLGMLLLIYSNLDYSNTNSREDYYTNSSNDFEIRMFLD